MPRKYRQRQKTLQNHQCPRINFKKALVSARAFLNFYGLVRGFYAGTRQSNWTQRVHPPRVVWRPSGGLLAAGCIDKFRRFCYNDYVTKR